MCQSSPLARIDETAKVLTLVRYLPIWRVLAIAKLFGFGTMYRVRPSTSSVANIAEMGRTTTKTTEPGQSNNYLADLCVYWQDIYQECRHTVSLELLGKMQDSLSKGDPGSCSYWSIW
jgi:hypothetical protein